MSVKIIGLKNHSWLHDRTKRELLRIRSKLQFSSDFQILIQIIVITILSTIELKRIKWADCVRRLRSNPSIAVCCRLKTVEEREINYCIIELASFTSSKRSFISRCIQRLRIVRTVRNQWSPIQCPVDCSPLISCSTSSKMVKSQSESKSIWQRMKVTANIINISVYFLSSSSTIFAIGKIL